MSDNLNVNSLAKLGWDNKTCINALNGSNIWFADGCITLFIYLFLSWSENKDTFTMCLFGWILGKKKGEEKKILGVWLDVSVGEKLVKFECFLSGFIKIFSFPWREKWGEKRIKS